MTAYHGGKQRIGQKIADIIYLTSTIIEDHRDFTIKGYCEPFCGMLGVYRHIPELFEDHVPTLKYLAGDVNESVIKMWQSAQKGWKPPTHVSKTEYDGLKYAKPSVKKGFVGHHCSFGGKNFRGYVKERCSGTNIQHGAQNVREIASDLTKVKFFAGEYSQFSRLKGYVIYCDPPYGKYSDYYDENHKTISFDHDKFWNWCRTMSKHNLVFISEYNAPKDFKLIVTINSHVSYGTGRQLDNKEKLFLIN